MESVFFRFESYDFEADLRFQDGLRGLNREGSNLLDLKLFFYNSYQQWSSASPRATPMDCGVEQPDQRTPSESENSPNQTAETEAGQLSFAEVMRLVQEGKEVPGATRLDIKATNQSPTPSQMQRRLKPWEIPSVSK
ncbi:hypothetical protein FQN60_002308 [Etheostoma spectabile]|uniref:Peroxisomal membrane protein PEX14-like KPWE domain-containing protein n=1 Tax=Etheostoma spectabile TaxID=54343 RepID=A0A5J5CAB9_9PERO|nr:hypothetical protein FQN60_007282 [Etheostoma spectabile]KAA8591365.1 hypothetical protein FQN60_002308 [Etheostoma spectabile]